MREYIVVQTSGGEVWLLPARRHTQNQYDTRPTETEATCVLRRCEEFEQDPQRSAFGVTVESAGIVWIDPSTSPKEVNFCSIEEWERRNE